MKKSRNEGTVKRYVLSKGGVWWGSFAWPLLNASSEWGSYWSFKAPKGFMRHDAVIGKRVFVYAMRERCAGVVLDGKDIVSTPEYAEAK